MKITAIDIASVYRLGEEEGPRIRDLNYYCCVRVRIGRKVYTVGAVVGVPPQYHATVLACGVEYPLTAWWGDETDTAEVPPHVSREDLLDALCLRAGRLYHEAEDIVAAEETL